MNRRNVALVGATVGAGFGVVGLIVPGFFATLFGIQIDETTTALIRLACASYVGLAVLDWMARDVTDAAAWRAIAVGSAIGWALSAVVIATALMSGLGSPMAWLMVAVQVTMALAWLSVVAQSSGRRVAGLPEGSAGR